MSWGFFAALTVLGTSMICFLGAWLMTSLNSENRAWSTLWSAALWVTALSPLVGLLLAVSLPQRVSEWSDGALFHTVLPGFVAVAEPLRDTAATEPGLGYQWIGWFALSSYLVGTGTALLRLLLGRRRVRRIALQTQDRVVIDDAQAFLSDAAHTPFVWTPFGRPTQSRVILPTSYLTAFSTADLKQIVSHEQAHVTRRDDEHGLCLRVFLAVLWISPFAHLAFARWSQACELQCDAQILKGRPRQARADYAQILIGALQLSANRVRQYPAATFSNHRLRNEKMRIANIMSGNGPVIKRTRTHVTLASIAAAVIVGAGSSLASLAHADPVGQNKDDRATMTLESIVTGRLTAPFGKTFDPFRDGSVRVHQGIDIGAPIGTAITAPADGRIVDATDLYNDQPSYGKVVVLQTADETLTLFSHLDTYSVQTGQLVKKGQKIAEVGNTGKSTGPHVHIETMVSGERVDPLTVWSVSP